MHLFLDIDNTLLDTVDEARKGLETIRIVVEGGQFMYVVLRPFVRWFLRTAVRFCKSVSIWTNGTQEWSSTVSELIFPEIPWFVVLNRSHSVKMSKALQRIFDRSDYPMTANDTYIIDDSTMTAEINKNNCIKIKSFKTGPLAAFDTGFLQIAVQLGWVAEMPGNAEWTPSVITKTSGTTYDPMPFGLVNQKLWCYFNSVAQCILRVPTIMKRVSKPLTEWFRLIQRKLGEGTQDAGEALIMLLSPLLNTPSQTVEGSTQKAGDEQFNSRSPVCMMYVQPNKQSTAQELQDYFDWKLIDNGEGVNGNKRIRSVWPGACITSVVMVVHRNTNARRVDRTPITVSPCVVTPDNRVLYLRGIVSHKGSANFGHYVSIFFRHDGTAWVADDTNITKIDTRLKLILSQSTFAAVIFYDEVGTFL